MNAAKVLLVATIMTSFSACASRPHPCGEPTPPSLTRYRDAVLRQLDHTEAALPEFTRSASKAAGKVLAGGNLYAGGQESFVIEAYVRAGGLMMLSVLDNKAAVSAADVVLVGASANDDPVALATCRRAREAGAYIVLFSPVFADADTPIAKLCDDHVANFADPGVEKETGRLSPLFNVTTLWTYTGELIGAMTRSGKMPVIWESVLLPGGRARNAKYYQVKYPLKRRFHEDLAVPAQVEGVLGRAYLDVVRRQVRGLRGSALAALDQASDVLAGAVRAGGTVAVKAISHFAVYEVRSSDAPRWSKSVDAPVDKVAAALKPHDAYFELGYYELNVPGIEAVRAAGAKSVIALCHAPIAPLNPAPDILLDAQWEYGDATVFVPGCDVKMLPASGVLQTVIFWTTVARVNEILTK